MTTAREQARENVHHRLGMHSPDIHDFMDECADAASDIWEPLLRRLLLEIETAPVQHAWLMDGGAYAEAKEALG